MASEHDFKCLSGNRWPSWVPRSGAESKGGRGRGARTQAQARDGGHPEEPFLRAAWEQLAWAQQSHSSHQLNVGYKVEHTRPHALTKAALAPSTLLQQVHNSSSPSFGAGCRLSGCVPGEAAGLSVKSHDESNSAHPSMPASWAVRRGAPPRRGPRETTRKDAASPQPHRTGTWGSHRQTGQRVSFRPNTQFSFSEAGGEGAAPSASRSPPLLFSALPSSPCVYPPPGTVSAHATPPPRPTVHSCAPQVARAHAAPLEITPCFEQKVRRTVSSRQGRGPSFQPDTLGLGASPGAPTQCSGLASSPAPCRGWTGKSFRPRNSKIILGVQSA